MLFRSRVHSKATFSLLVVASWLQSSCGSSLPPPAAQESDESAEASSSADESTNTDPEVDVDLLNRAYIVSKLSDELTVIDLNRLEILGQVKTNGRMNHMADLAQGFRKVYVDSSESDEAVVIDAVRLKVINRVNVGKHPTHLTVLPDDRRLAIMLEGDNAVAFVDTQQDTVIKTLTGFATPHFLRFSSDGKTGYVANIGGYHLTTVDLATLEITGTIALEGHSADEVAADEQGFADAQIDRNGILFAAHAGTGKVMVVDTHSGTKLPELGVGAKPWVVFAEHPYSNIAPRHLVANFGDQTVSVIAASNAGGQVFGTLPGDEEAYGVNVSPLVPNLAFVMNRMRHDVAVVDVMAGRIVQRIDVGGSTETASTSADGKYIVAAVSSANRVVVLDAKTQSVIKWFDDVGEYPWSVTIPFGQNYCH